MTKESKIHFTSDTHFLHPNIIKTRPEFQTQEVISLMATHDAYTKAYEVNKFTDLETMRGVTEALTLALEDALLKMTEEMVDRWNQKVKPTDIVHHLGDFALSWGRRKHFEPIAKLLSRLHGRKHLIMGNHDRREVVKQPAWASVKHYAELKLDLGGEGKQRICMGHYAYRTWNQMHRGAWMLHGHSHGNLSDVGGKIVDVGVDAWNFAPVSLAEISEYMSHREVSTAGDHHELP